MMGLGEVEGKFDVGWRFLWRLTGVRVFVEGALGLIFYMMVDVLRSAVA